MLCDMQVTSPVFAFDDMRVRPARRAAVIDRLEQVYLPLASALGIELIGTWLLPPLEAEDEATDLVLMWRYNSIEAWWVARIAEARDAKVRLFWNDLDQDLVSRTRRLGSAAGHAPPPSKANLDRPMKLPPPGFRYLAYVQSRDPGRMAAEDRWLRGPSDLGRHDDIALSGAGLNGAFSSSPFEMSWDIVARRRDVVTPELLRNSLPPEAELSQLVRIDNVVASGSRFRGDPSTGRRSALIAVEPGTARGLLQGLEEALSGLARRVDGINAWSLAKVSQLAGRESWAYCFEQEFTLEHNAISDYMNHPYHWAVADRYFAPDSPYRIVSAFRHATRMISGSIFESMNN